MMQQTKAGDKLVFTIIRKKQSKKIKITLGKRSKIEPCGGLMNKVAPEIDQITQWNNLPKGKNQSI